jgi:hypothetical protein
LDTGEASAGVKVGDTPTAGAIVAVAMAVATGVALLVGPVDV